MVQRTKKTVDFSGIEAWVFDLDNTLYPASARLFDQINVQMTDFITEALNVERAHANALRRELWERHGTTMAGLVAEHGVDADDFLVACHQLDLSGLSTDPHLADAIRTLPGRSLVHTNGPRFHAERILQARGLTHCFESLTAIEDTAYRSKPSAQAYALAHAVMQIDPRRAAMIEDHVENLREPKRLGMATIWLAPDGALEAPDYVDVTITDLNGFLASL